MRFSNLASMIENVLQFDKKNFFFLEKNKLHKYTILEERCISQRVEILSEVDSFLMHAFERNQI